MKNSILVNPLVRIFTTFILCIMIIMPFTKDFWTYHDGFVTVIYCIVAVYVLGKKAYDIWGSK